MQYDTPYEPPTLTVDFVGLQVVDSQLQVMLIKRPNEPFQGIWALPGGYNPKGETTRQALERIIGYKTGISVKQDFAHVEQLYTFDTIARDPRGHAVSVTYAGYGHNISLPECDAETAFFAVDQLPEVAYDHAEIITMARQRLIAKLAYTNIAKALLPAEFTLTELQQVYEAVHGDVIDKRNFRKKILSLESLEATGGVRASGRHRPAKLYAFNAQTIQPSL